MPKGKTVIVDNASLELLSAAAEVCRDIVEAHGRGTLQIDRGGAAVLESDGLVLAREAIQAGIIARHERERIDREHRIAELELERSRRQRAAGAR